MQEISVVSGKPPSVYRAAGSRTVYVTFEGLRESRTVADKLTRIQIALPANHADELVRALGSVMTEG